MNYKLLNPSRFISSVEFEGKDVTFTIEKVFIDELERDDKSKEKKGIIAFRETAKQLVINKVNAESLKGMFGVETDAWIGRRVVLYAEPMKDPFTGEQITATRVRGSPDISSDVTITVRQRRKKATTRNLKRITTAPPAPIEGDALAKELAIVEGLIIECNTVEQCDKAWSSGLGGRINRLPKEDSARLTKVFTRHKGLLVKAAATPAADAPPPAAEPGSEG